MEPLGLLILLIVQRQIACLRLHYHFHLAGGDIAGGAGQFHIGIAQPGYIKGRHLTFARPRKKVMGDVNDLLGSLVKPFGQAFDFGKLNAVCRDALPGGLVNLRVMG